MPAARFRTDLNCASCVAKVAPFLDAEPQIEQWSVDTSTPAKVLSVEGTGVESRRVAELVSRAGFHVLGQIEEPVAAKTVELDPVEIPRSWWATYRPLLLIVGYLIIGSLILGRHNGAFDWRLVMNRFMAGFFLVFSYFKLLDLDGFASAFSGYDILARRSRTYAIAYPFIELSLGVLYLAGWMPVATNIVALAIMSIGLVGVVLSVLSKQTIRCACLGTGFNLPMSTVTIIEDGVMAAMAAAMLVAGAH